MDHRRPSALCILPQLTHVDGDLPAKRCVNACALMNAVQESKTHASSCLAIFCHLTFTCSSCRKAN